MTTTGTATQQKWNRWGTSSYTVMPHVSPESKAIAETYQLRPTDVVVLSFPKTGTTWTQTVCEQLRTRAEGYDGFGDITERQPWLEFAHDCGQDLDDGLYDAYKPRIFKSHQLLSAINPGGKYLCIVRDPAATLLSWFSFQKAKGRPGYAEYKDANEYIKHRPELFGGHHIFGTNLWQMYAEIWSARNDPSVKVLVYEALIADGPNDYMDHLPVIHDFLGLRTNHTSPEEDEETKTLYQKVAFLVSRAEMVRHAEKFKDTFIAEMGKKHGRALRIMEPAAKVRSKSDKRAELDEDTLEWLEDQWLEKITPHTGHATYDEFATELSDLFFEGVVDEKEVEKAGAEPLPLSHDEIEKKQHRPSRKSSILVRRKSSIVVQQMPSIRQRRETLAPLD